MRYKFLFFLLFLAGCERPSPTLQTVAIDAPVVATAVPAPPEMLATTSATPTLRISPTPTVVAAESAAPFFSGAPSPPCGQILPIVGQDASPVPQLSVDPSALANLRTIAPEEAWPAVQQMLDAPETVGLALYRAGDVANGVYFNAERAMPVASVAKLITLAAYAEAVDRGELDPSTAVSLDTLDQYYLPRFDLNAHPRALRNLAENGRLLENDSAMALEDAAWIMTRFSSNAAADYLHRLLGQEMIEETAVRLGLASQTAPCTFLGQFLAMHNHTRGGSDRLAVEAYIADPVSYRQEVELLADAYINDPHFRSAERAARGAGQRPSLQTQRLFSHELAPQASPLDYATAMHRIAQNGLVTPEASFIARRILEWPMVFENNQARFTNLGYKNGALPGVRTTVYYAYRADDGALLVIALFYENLPDSTYRVWRRTLPDDEFARWALGDPAALPALRAVFGGE